MTTKTDIEGWFKEGMARNATHLLVVCDSFSHEDYPVYVRPEEDFWIKHDTYDGKNMQKIMEVYDLKQDMASQLDARRSWSYPQRAATA